VVAGGTSLSYDRNGNRASEVVLLPGGRTRTTDYRYDREDRLVSVVATVRDGERVVSRMEARYDYDGYGRRARKVVAFPGLGVPTTTTIYLYDGLDIIGAQVEVDGKQSESYYYLAPSPITGLARPFQFERLPNDSTGGQGQRLWYQSDGLDSVIALTDERGTLVAPALYDEYGGHLVGTGDPARFTYTGQDYDAETGLLHFYARYYDPARGVWLGQDAYRGQLPFPLTIHRYGYVGNNPIVRIDEYGYAWQAFVIATVVGAAKGALGQGLGDLFKWEWSGWEAYIASSIAGAIAADVALLLIMGGTTAPAAPIVAGALEGGLSKFFTEFLRNRSKLNEWCWKNALRDALIESVYGGATAGVPVLKDVPAVRGRVAQGLRYFISRRALKQYQDATRGLINDTTWKQVQRVIEQTASDIELGIINRDFCSDNEVDDNYDYSKAVCKPNSTPPKVVPAITPTPPPSYK
jgi:RHS repeat-associated protein